MNKIQIDAADAKTKISKHIYGHFAEHLGRCIYDGIWVGEDSQVPNLRGFRKDIVDALCQIHTPNLRWPGGCFADTYHWMDGIGSREKRPSIVNIHWGNVTENNHVGTHEFMDLCSQLGCEPYVCGNVGSGTVREMAEWLEYLTMAGKSPMADLRRKNGREEPWNLRYWAVGNENWGCGGNMRPQYYADLYRQYATYCRHFNRGRLYKIACGQEDDWNKVIMKDCTPFMDGLSVHYYTMIAPNWGQPKGSATKFNESDWFRTMDKAADIEPFIVRTKAIMDEHDTRKRVGIIMDEWGTWWDVEPDTNPGFLYQQNTIRDAVVAGLSLNIFNNHADRVHMANIAQTVNVLQAMVLTEGPRMLLTPTYHVFEMFKVHQDATLLPSKIESDEYADGDKKTAQVNVSASQKDGVVHISLCNLHHEKSASVEAELKGITQQKLAGRILTGAMAAMNTFDKPDEVKPQSFDGAKLAKGSLTVELPARSVVMLELR